MLKFSIIIAFFTSALLMDFGTSETQGSPASVLTSDSLALVALFQSTDGSNWSQTWNLSDPIVDWYGITLDTAQTRVVGIDLENNNLLGNLPVLIGDLSKLQILRLQRNQLRGTIPNEIVQLDSLVELFLYSNELTGAIPDSIGRLSNLRMLSIANNTLTGSIPSSIGILSNLKRLVLDQNQLTGVLPQSITNLSNLNLLDLHNNQLNGTLPDSMQGFQSLEEFLIFNNFFEGTFPSTMSKMTQLTHLWASNNRIEGGFPDFSNLPLRSIRVDQNKMTGLGDFHNVPTLGRNTPNGVITSFNQLSFEDILPNLDLVDSINFVFKPQDTLRLQDTIIVRQGDPWIYQLPFDDTVTTSSYKWFRNDKVVEISSNNQFVIPSVSNADAGWYRCRINNRILTDLTLYTSTIRLIVKRASDCGNPPAARECFLSETLCNLGVLDGYCADMDDNSNQENVSFCGKDFTLIDRDWFSFIAGEVNMRLRITPYNCDVNSDGGLVAWVFDNCNLGTPLNCDTVCQRSTFEMSLNGLTVGKKYYLLIGGCDGICSYELDVRNGGAAVHLNVPGEIIGLDSICDGNSTYIYKLDTPVIGADSYRWFINHRDTSFSFRDSAIQVEWPFPGKYRLCVQASNACDTSDLSCREIRVFSDIALNDISTEIFEDDEVYSVTFTIDGGTSPYIISGARGIYNALEKSFTSDIIACGEGYRITVTDANGCEKLLLGVEYCNCISAAGEMASDTLHECEFTAFRGDFLGGEVLDSNDIRVFILHEGDSNNGLGNLIDLNETGVFRFDPSIMDIDSVYYVSLAVGNQLPSGELQFNDPCLAISNAQPVLFHRVPEANAGRDTLVCFGRFNLNAQWAMAGSRGIWQYVQGPKKPVISQPNMLNSSVIIQEAGVYVFRWLEINDDCIGSDSVIVVVRPPLSVAIQGKDAICDGLQTDLGVNASFASYQWTTGDVTPSITVSKPGIYGVTVTDEFGCLASASKTIDEEASPIVIVRGESDICRGESFQLVTHSDFASYEWSTGDTTKNILTDFEGIICVTVTNDKGCIGDDCIITQYRDPSSAEIDTSICFGDQLSIGNTALDVSGKYEIVLSNANKNGCDSILTIKLEVYPKIYISDTLILHDDGTGSGAISVSIEGGKRPYDYHWSSGDTSPFISRLKAGDYILTVTDANGCARDFIFNIESTTATKKVIKNAWSLRVLPNIISSAQRVALVGFSEQPIALNVSVYHAQKNLISFQKINLEKGNKTFDLGILRNTGLYFIVVEYQHHPLKIMQLMVVD